MNLLGIQSTSYDSINYGLQIGHCQSSSLSHGSNMTLCLFRGTSKSIIYLSKTGSPSYCEYSASQCYNQKSSVFRNNRNGLRPAGAGTQTISGETRECPDTPDRKTDKCKKRSVSRCLREFQLPETIVDTATH